MTPQERPEWFEISEGDDSANVRRVSKRLPISALVVTLAILGVGAVVAQTQEQSPASAIETTTPVETQSLTTTNPTTPDVTNAPGLASAPSIANPPKQRDGDDDDDDRGKRHGSRPSHDEEDDDDDDEGFGDDD
jgi:hypothetical protein